MGENAGALREIVLMTCKMLAWGTAVAIGLTLSMPGLAEAATYPVTPNIGVGIIQAFANPAAPPAGANLPSCHSAAHIYPVVLVNGTFTVSADDFGALAPDLANAGYCVYTFNYGGIKSTDPVQAIGPVAQGAQALASFVSKVRAATGTTKVDLVGHSQGGLVTEYYAKVLHGAPNVHSIVALSPTTHGTTLDGLTLLANVIPGANQLVATGCPACRDQEAGSTVITTLNNGPVAQQGVTYTIIETLNETVVTPVGSSFIREPGVTNEYVQQFCPLDTVDHVSLPYDNVAIQLVKNALTPATAIKPSCLTAFPYPAL